MKNLRVGELLIEKGLINQEQLNKALALQKQLSNNKKIGQLLIDQGYVSEDEILEVVSKRLAIEILDINKIQFHHRDVEKIPKALAEKYNIIAFKTDSDGDLCVLTNDPLNYYGLEDVRLATGGHLKVFMAHSDAIKVAIEKEYSNVEAREIAKDIDVSNMVETPLETISLENENDETPIIKLLNSLLIRGYRNNASDIHIEPFKDKISVRMRVDGMLLDYIKLEKNILAPLVVRIKIISNMDIAEKRLPQDGQFVGNVDNEEMNMRVSVIPTIYGEKIVMRYLNSATPIQRLDTFGMTESNFEKIKHMMNMPHGIIYVTGPTGSGKTTTLYMILEELAKKELNISTIEDPVEKKIARINQMQVNQQAGLTFEKGLRALMRQDPDIIMVGETRDSETASIASRAAITGHLVVSTLHTNDAISTVVRLEDMGIEPYIVANSLIGAVAQRLVRTICPYCKAEREATVTDKIAIGEEIKKVSYGKGCPHCNGTGYQGRIAIHEIVLLDSKIRHMISDKEDIDKITEYLVNEQNIETLFDQAKELVKNGMTTIEELNKISSYID